MNSNMNASPRTYIALDVLLSSFAFVVAVSGYFAPELSMLMAN